MKRTWLVLDVNFLSWRQFYGGARREPRAVLPGVMSYVRGLYERFGTSDTVWTFDRGPYHRATLYPGYKASRTRRTVDDETAAAEAELRSAVDEFRTHHLEELGYANVYHAPGYEADDMMAVICRNLPADDDAILVSGDHDLYQLLSARVSVFHPVTGQIVTRETFRTTYGIHPSQWPTVKAIAGCNTDDIPGVDGVGEQTALKWVRGEPIPAKRAEAIRGFERCGGITQNLELIELPWGGGFELEHPPQPETREPALYNRWMARRGIRVIDSRRSARVVDEPDLFTDGG